MPKFLHGYDMFQHVVNKDDYICHFQKGNYSKIQKHFGQVVNITDQYFYYKEKSNNRITKGKQYNCVKVDEYSYNVCDNEPL